MSLLFNMLSRFVIAFLPRSKHLLIPWLHSASAVILEPRKIRCHCFHFSPIYGSDIMILAFWMLSFKPVFSTLLSPSSRASLVPLHFLPLGWYHLSIWGISQIFLPTILIPAYESSSSIFCMIYSAYKLNKQGDIIQPWHTSFSILNQSVGPCPVLNVASWPAYRFLKRQVTWFGIPISLRIFQFIMIYTVKGFSIASEAEIDVFLEFSCFFYDPMNVGSLISGSSAFSKSSLYIWKFLVHVLLRPSLKNFEHDFASMWNECNWMMIWTFFGIALLQDWNENWPFSVL